MTKVTVMGGSNHGWESSVGRRNGHGEGEACYNADREDAKSHV